MATPCPAAAEFADGLTAKFADLEFVFHVEPGQVRDRIVRTDKYGHGSVHAFVCRSTGGVLKPEGYRKAAQHIRYPNVQAALEAADWSGGYLYAR